MLKFSRTEVEGPLSDCFPHKSIKAISIITGIGASYLEQWINANDERKSPTFQTLQIQCALDESFPDEGERHWQKLGQFRSLSLPAQGCLDVTTEGLKNHKESFDVAEAVMSGKPLYKQLDEVCQQIDQANRHKQAILDAISAEMTNGGASRFDTRSFAKQAVDKRK